MLACAHGLHQLLGPDQRAGARRSRIREDRREPRGRRPLERTRRGFRRRGTLARRSESLRSPRSSASRPPRSSRVGWPRGRNLPGRRSVEPAAFDGQERCASNRSNRLSSTLLALGNRITGPLSSQPRDCRAAAGDIGPNLVVSTPQGITVPCGSPSARARSRLTKIAVERRATTHETARCHQMYVSEPWNVVTTGTRPCVRATAPARP